MRVLALCSLLILASCTPRIPEHVLDAEWCRSMEAAKADADERGRRNLSLAMKEHRCEAKLAAAAGRARSGALPKETRLAAGSPVDE
ncbi:hypothetical protein [Shinella sp.]|uniref:hypothetical protein n=1 Tax=Shinella sp. TaxID=1870904 RepID=UPI00301E3A29